MGKPVLLSTRVAVMVCDPPIALGPAVAGDRAKTGATGEGFTVTVVCEVLVLWPSFALSCRTYVPTTGGKLTVVTVLFGLEKTTVPGPLI